MQDNMLDLTKLGKTRESEEQVSEPDKDGNEWFGVDRIINGQKQFHAFSGLERRRIRRANERFAKAQVNRVWFHLMGRGIVDPIDDFRPTTPPTHPALLDALAK